MASFHGRQGMDNFTSCSEACFEPLQFLQGSQLQVEPDVRGTGDLMGKICQDERRFLLYFDDVDLVQTFLKARQRLMTTPGRPLDEEEVVKLRGIEIWCQIA